jgi:hypothetical protein
MLINQYLYLLTPMVQLISRQPLRQGYIHKKEQAISPVLNFYCNKMTPLEKSPHKF